MWKLLAYFATAIAVIGLITALKNKQEAERLAALLNQRTVPVVSRPAPAPQRIDKVGVHPDYEVVQLRNELERDGYRCIRGQLFKIDADTWEQIGQCPKLSHE